MADQSKMVAKDSQDLWSLPKYLRMVLGKKMLCALLPVVVTWCSCPRHTLQWGKSRLGGISSLSTSTTFFISELHTQTVSISHPIGTLFWQVHKRFSGSEPYFGFRWHSHYSLRHLKQKITSFLILINLSYKYL